MPGDHFVGDGQKAAVRTISAFDSRLFTNATNPFITAGRRITGFPGPPALETARIHILPAPEKRSEQGYLRGGRGNSFEISALRWNFSFFQQKINCVTSLFSNSFPPPN